MEVYVARQPIFDRHMQVYGYELLYRKSNQNRYEGDDDVQSTIALVNNAFLVFGLNELTEGAKGFINFPEKLLLGELAYMLPKDQVVIEILERVEPTKEVIAHCRKLKATGYLLALDDFVLERDTEGYLPLIELADIIKVEFPSVSPRGISSLMKRYGGSVTFLAEKVETKEEHQLAMDMGFHLFQGYFFSRPQMSSVREIGLFDVHLLQVLKELESDDVNFERIADIIQQDMGLSYKLLRMANSVFFGAKYQIDSIRRAVVRVGTEELHRWVHLMLLRGVQRPDNQELVKTSIIRGKTLSLMARELGRPCESEYFITGLFSSIDVLLNAPMERALQGLPLADDVRGALLGQDNSLRRCLDAVLTFERARWEDWKSAIARENFTAQKYMDCYIEALRWQQTLAS